MSTAEPGDAPDPLNAAGAHGALDPGLLERRVVGAFALLNLPFVLASGVAYLTFLVRPASVWLTLYLGLSFLLHFGCLWAIPGALAGLGTRGRRARWLGPALACGLYGLLHAFLLVDARVFHSFRFHVNGFVLEVLLQDDLGKAIGLERSDVVSLALQVAGVFAVELAAYLALRRLLARRAAAPRPPRVRRRVALLAAVLLLIGGERLGFAWFHFRGRSEATAQARAFPFYVPVTMSTFLRKLVGGENAVPTPPECGRYLDYPRAPIQLTGHERRLNVVWIVVESWRADLLTPEITPHTYAFAQESLTGARHLSGGNATRLGLFSMFYGLHPAKYSYFHDARRGPVLIETLLRMGYEPKVLSSASLKFLGPHETVFADVRDAIEDSFAPGRAASDHAMADRFIGWLDQRADPKRPFFGFLFFDGSHTHFDFEPGFDRFKPYLKDLHDIDERPEKKELFLNRYRNALLNIDHHIDRVLRALRARELLQKSVVVIVGDHGQEFWEHGYFTHSSAFTEQQLAVPLVLHAPGLAPRRLERLTSHLDLPATIFDLLHVEADPASYSQGRSLLSGPPRRFAVASGWDDHAYIDDEIKIVFHQANAGVALWEVTDAHDEPVAHPRAWLRKKSGALVECFKLFPEFLTTTKR